MDKKYFYYQPEYVDKFKCDGAKCNARCCKNWNIFIDKETYKKYPQEVIGHLKFNSKRGEYLMKLDEKKFCPMLTENNLCSLQLKYGEEFLSITCATYPRYTRDFGKFFERSLTLTCPVAAELILLQREPMRFNFVEVSEKIHSNGGKIQNAKIQTAEEFTKYMLEIQIALIAILQNRTLTINQRLIVVGFFLDKLTEIYFKDLGVEDLLKLIAAYKSKKFWAEQVPLMLRIVSFNSRKFIELIFKLFESLYGGEKAKLTETGREIMNTVVDVLQIKPDKNNKVLTSETTANYEKLAEARKIFAEEYSPFLENYLVNEFFMNVYPWHFAENLAKNYAVFVATYKIFELLIFSATQKGFSSKEDLLKIVDSFTTQSDHTKDFQKKILEHFKNTDDIFPVMENLLEQ